MRRRVGGKHTSPFWGAWINMIRAGGRGDMKGSSVDSEIFKEGGEREG